MGIASASATKPSAESATPSAVKTNFPKVSAKAEPSL